MTKQSLLDFFQQNQHCPYCSGHCSFRFAIYQIPTGSDSYYISKNINDNFFIDKDVSYNRSFPSALCLDAVDIDGFISISDTKFQIEAPVVFCSNANYAYRKDQYCTEIEFRPEKLIIEYDFILNRTYFNLYYSSIVGDKDGIWVDGNLFDSLMKLRKEDIFENVQKMLLLK